MHCGPPKQNFGWAPYMVYPAHVAAPTTSLSGIAWNTRNIFVHVVELRRMDGVCGWLQTRIQSNTSSTSGKTDRASRSTWTAAYSFHSSVSAASELAPSWKYSAQVSTAVLYLSVLVVTKFVQPFPTDQRRLIQLTVSSFIKLTSLSNGIQQL